MVMNEPTPLNRSRMSWSLISEYVLFGHEDKNKTEKEKRKKEKKRGGGGGGKRPSYPSHSVTEWYHVIRISRAGLTTRTELKERSACT